MSSLAGLAAEAQALDFLKTQGLTYLEKNFRSHTGEIDLIMEDGDTLVFVEVKYRKSINHGSPIESITPDKLRKIRQTADYYLLSTQQYDQRFCRIDVVAIESEQTMEWLKDVA